MFLVVQEPCNGKVLVRQKQVRDCYKILHSVLVASSKSFYPLENYLTSKEKVSLKREQAELHVRIQKYENKLLTCKAVHSVAGGSGP